MRGADVLWFVFSAGGAVLFFLGAAIWVAVRPRSAAARRALVTIAAGYVILSIYAVPHTAALMLARGFHPLAPGDVPQARIGIILLGSGDYSRENWSGDVLSVPDPIGMERLLEAFRAYRLVKASWVISSGGRVGRSGPSGETMRDVLVRMGVPAAQVIVENESKSTRDEAVRIAAMLPGLDVDRVVLVTSAVHMRRSLGAFRTAGIDAIPAVARESADEQIGLYKFLPTAYGLGESAMVVHELAGMAYYALRGWYT